MVIDNSFLTLDLGQTLDANYELHIQASSVYLHKPTGYAHWARQAYIVQSALNNLLGRHMIIGSILVGVVADYKESDKILAEIATSL